MSLVAVGRLGGSQGDREQRKQSRDGRHFLLHSRHEVTRSRRQQEVARKKSVARGQEGDLGTE